MVDRDYTREILVILHNSGNTKFTITRWDRIAQLVSEWIAHSEVHIIEKLEETTWGKEGFGFMDLNAKFQTLLNITVWAIWLVSDLLALVKIQVCETIAIEDEDKIQRDELVYM